MREPRDPALRPVYALTRRLDGALAERGLLVSSEARQAASEDLQQAKALIERRDFAAAQERLRDALRRLEV